MIPIDFVIRLAAEYFQARSMIDSEFNATEGDDAAYRLDRVLVELAELTGIPQDELHTQIIAEYHRLRLR